MSKNRMMQGAEQDIHDTNVALRPRLERRLGWIEAYMRYAGSFGSAEKADYREQHALSVGQVSEDQSKFAKEMNRRYGADIIAVIAGRLRLLPDKSMPREPAFTMPTQSEWLQATLGNGFTQVEPARRSDPEPRIIRQVVDAVRKRRTLKITYLSRSTGRSTKTISAHMIIDVVDRLHVRAYDHDQQRFSDFVISRIETAMAGEDAEPYVSSARDADWNRMVQIRISAASDLDGTRLRGVARDFGLDQSGSKQLTCRAAVAGYLVDENDRTEQGMRSPVVVALEE